jgi:hypothetical protein
MPITKWWDAKKPDGPSKEEWERDRAQALIDETASIENRQKAWHEFNLWNSTLFYNREVPALRWGINADVDSELFPADLRTENLVSSIGEAMLSKACSQPLVPSPVPHSSSYTAKKAVDRLRTFLASTWLLTKAERAAVQSFLDAYVSGLGAVRVVYSEGLLSVEPVFYDNLIIDNRECVNRVEPRTVRIRTVMPRVAAEARYGDLDAGQYPQRQYVDYREVGDDWVVVVEAWRKPINGKGGRHSIACCGKLLDDEPWTSDWVPVVFLHWADPGSGFFCKSGVEQCIPYQVKHNELNDDIKDAQDLCCRPRILAHANSNIDVNQWDNEAGRILGYTGVEPKPFVWPTEINDLYQERERNRAAAYSYFGLSEMSASADLPAQVRLDSSAGVREFRNMEDSRHLRLWTRLEEFRLEIAHRLLDVLSGSKRNFSVAAVKYLSSDRSSAGMISYDDVKELRKEQYSWTLEAVPLSSMSPAARRETLAAWQSEGKIKPDDDVSMVGNPDLEKIDSQEQSSVDDVHRMFALMENGDYESPPEYTNFTYGIRACVENIHILKGFSEGVHPQAIQLHEQWLLEAMNTQAAAVQALQAQQQMQMQPPGFSPQQGVQGQIQ